MKYTEILELLFENKTPFNQINHSPNQPGIYAIYFHGEAFPDSKLTISKDDLIYIEKIESIQQTKDWNMHFKSSNTGSSTLRRTIGSLLREELELIPIPRNAKDFKKRRTTYYKFDESGEGKITTWMVQSLSLSFYEYPKSPQAIDLLETELIKIAKPIFNLSKNPNNPIGDYLRSQRKSCGELAYSQSTYNQTTGSVEVPKDKAYKYIPTRSEEGFSPRSFVESRDERSNSEK